MSNSVRPHRRQPTWLRRPWDSPGKNTGVGCHFLLQWMKEKSESEVAQLCLTLSDPMDCSPPGSSIHGIFQARVLEWGAIAFSEVALVVSNSLHPYGLQPARLLHLWNSPGKNTGVGCHCLLCKPSMGPSKCGISFSDTDCVSLNIYVRKEERHKLISQALSSNHYRGTIE